MWPISPIVKSEEDLDILYANRMAKSGPFQITRTANAEPPVFNKTGHWTEKENAKYYAFLKKFRLKF